MPERSLVETCLRAFAAGERGDLAATETACEVLAPLATLTARGWAAALAAQRSAFGAAGPMPDEATLAVFLDAPPEVRTVVARVCALGEREAVVGLHADRLDAWIALHERLLRDLPDAPQGLDLALARLWRSVVCERGAEGAPEARQLFQQASRARHASVVIEATAVEALMLARAGDAPTAMDVARRACRMAQAEGLPLSEYLAHLVLARLRRRAGHPHLALHITSALAKVVPPVWRAWIAWEMLLAGAPAAVALGPVNLAAPAPRALAATLEACRAGEPRRFEDAAAALIAASEGRADIRREAGALLAALDTTWLAADDVGPWRNGGSGEVPAGLHGIAALSVDALAGDQPLAYVVGTPEARGQRILAAAVPVAAFLGARRLEVGTSAGLRTQTGLAVLALAGPEGLQREEFFRAVYGFAFVGLRHQDMLDTLVVRMRELLTGLGTLVRDERTKRLSLALAHRILVPDMRCVLPVADHVLRALAGMTAGSAQDAAELLHMPLRSVQRVLQHLVDDGALAVARAGRNIVYRVKDTTFTTITLAPPGGPPR